MIPKLAFQIQTSSITGQSGQFCFELKRAPTVITVRKRGWAPDSTTFHPMDSNSISVELVLELKSVLERKVPHEDGTPATNAEVRVTKLVKVKPMLGDGWMSYTLSPELLDVSYRAHTDADGRFTLVDFPSNARAQLLCMIPGKAALAEVAAQTAHTGNATISLESSSVVVTLAPEGGISGARRVRRRCRVEI